MRITTWNVNSIRKRLETVLSWIERNRPDVLCLQEIKCTESQFPSPSFAAAGYQITLVGQKAYNGVAIASLRPQLEVRNNPVSCGDRAARSLGVTVDGIRILTVYVPHGDAVGTAGFRYKLHWLECLGRLLRQPGARPLVVVGDLNVAPEDCDAYDPKGRHERLMCSTPERERFSHLLDAGYVDAFRSVNPEGGHYTWWSHRVGAVRENRGLRVDHVLLDAAHSDGIVDVGIDVKERRRTGASDHAPVTLTWLKR